jgi:adenosine deaminase
MRSLALAGLLACTTITFADQAGAVRAFERARASDPQLVAFLREMPKGGDLHNHVSGAAYSDFMLDLQVARHRHYDPAKNQFTDDAGKPPASILLQNNDYLYNWQNQVSMRGWTGVAQTGHDHFFATFDYISSALSGITGAQLLGEVVKRAMWQHEHYMELMTSVVPGPALDEYYKDEPASDDMKAALNVLRPRLEKLLPLAQTFVSARDAELTKLLGLKRSVSDPASPITLRYIWSCYRLSPNDDFFAQAACGMFLASHDARIVAINIVQPEDHPLARQNFERQMQMLDFLWRNLGRPHITLHAAELNLANSPVEAMRDRIWKSIQLGHAQRIGHGVSVAWSDDVSGLLGMMKKERIAVEICLTSNRSILGIFGREHPFQLYRSAGVPLILNTDDEGVSRSNLTTECLRAVREQGVGYEDLKEMARNSIEYSFLSGKSLYVGRDFSKLNPAFALVRTPHWRPSSTALGLMHSNQKLEVEVRLERSFAEFEQRFR